MPGVTCEVSTSLDKNLDRYKRLISDSFIMLLAYFFLAVVCIMGLVYIIKNLYKTISTYVKYRDMYQSTEDKSVGQQSDNVKDRSGDDEYYPVDPEEVPRASYIPQEQPEFGTVSAKRFFKTIDDVYSDYNTQKTAYIAQTYEGRKNDDVINKKMAYAKYDDYDYD